MPNEEQSQTNIAADQQVNSLNVRALAGFVVSLVCVVIVVLAAWQIPLWLDTRASEQASDRIANYMAQEGERLGIVSLEYAYWNDAVDRVVYERNSEWADVEIGSYLNKVMGIAKLRAINRSGETVYEFSDSAMESFDLWNEVQAETEALRSDVLGGTPSDPDFSTSYVMTSEGLFLLAAAPFTAYQPTDLDTSTFHGVLYLARGIDGPVLAQWSDVLGVRNLALHPAAGTASDGASAASLMVRGGEGEPVARLSFEPQSQGRALLGVIGPWGLSLGVVFLVASGVMLSSLRQLVRSARSNIAELDQQKARLFHQAMFDEVSNLHNRNYLISRLQEEIARIRRTNSSAVFIFLDLDGFKRVNDTMGHSAGDELLRQVGERLLASVRDEDVVCRFGGDEFCILVTGLQERDTSDVRELAESLARKVIEELERPFTVDDKPVKIGASSGLVVIPDDTADVEDILRFGDLAMYEAKREIGNAFIHYRQDFLHDINFRNAVRHKLDSAVPNKEFSLHYQPIYSVGTGKVVGYEALARWNSTELGSIPPSQFIAIAEETDTIVRLGKWVIEEALRDLKVLQSITRDGCFVAINVAERQLADAEFCEFLEARMMHYEVYPGDVHIELTESYRFGREKEEIQRLLRVNEKGVQVSLDNFGTGYASLSYLQDYPLSTVKIDRNFVANLLDDSKMEGIVGAVVHMAKTLGIRVIASGVETAEQEQALRNLGVHWVQGFHYAHPAPLDTYVDRNRDSNPE